MIFCPCVHVLGDQCKVISFANSAMSMGCCCCACSVGGGAIPCWDVPNLIIWVIRSEHNCQKDGSPDAPKSNSNTSQLFDAVLLPNVSCWATMIQYLRMKSQPSSVHGDSAAAIIFLAWEYYSQGYEVTRSGIRWGYMGRGQNNRCRICVGRRGSICWLPKLWYSHSLPRCIVAIYTELHSIHLHLLILKFPWLLLGN